jgi:hypothetical protein
MFATGHRTTQNGKSCFSLQNTILPFNIYTHKFSKPSFSLFLPRDEGDESAWSHRALAGLSPPITLVNHARRPAAVSLGVPIPHPRSPSLIAPAVSPASPLRSVPRRPSSLSRVACRPILPPVPKCRVAPWELRAALINALVVDHVATGDHGWQLVVGA